MAQALANGTGHGQALVIEGDEAYRAAISACVRLADLTVQQVESVDHGLRMLDRRKFELVVLGAAPDLNSRSAATTELRLRTEGALVVVADDSATAQVYLDAGADQWLPKPFVPGALVAALRAARRRLAGGVMTPAVRIETRGLILDGASRTLACGDDKTVLTAHEWDLVMILVAHPNRYLTAREILSLGWRSGEYGVESVRIYVQRLRRKFRPMALPFHLLSRHGQGYCLSFD